MTLAVDHPVGLVGHVGEHIHRLEELDRATLRTRGLADERLRRPHARPLHEARFGVEVLLHVEEVHVHVPLGIAIGNAAIHGHVVADFAGCFGLGQVRADLQAAAKRKVGIDAHRPVEVARARLVLVDEDGADARAPQDVAAVAADEEVVTGTAEGAVGLDVEHADVMRARLARQPRAADDRHRLARGRQADATTEEQIGLHLRRRERRPGAHREEVRVLEEEVALLREEEAEAREVDLLVVDFHLGEVGVEREIEVEPGRQAIARIEADVTHHRRGVDRWRRRDDAPAAHGEGLEPQVEPAAEIAQAVELTRQADARETVGAGDGRPVGDFVLPPGVAQEVDAPHLFFRRTEPHGRKGNQQLGRPALVGDLRRRVPHAVPVAVDGRRRTAAAALAFVKDLLLEARAERRRDEHVAVARVVEGVEDDLEVVLVKQAVGVAPHLGGHHRHGRHGLEPDVEIALVVQDPHLGAVGLGLPR